jgi:PPOX class probable F420-dependent enzyme
MSVLPDPDSDFGARVRARLREEYGIWLTTVGADGTPQPNPVWFLWEDESESMLVYNRNTAKRLAHVAANPRVSAHFDTDGQGGDVVVLTGVAEPADDVAAPDRHQAYLAKYADGIEGIGLTPESFAAVYGTALRIRVDKIRGF